jgi:hypothetical protein
MDQYLREIAGAVVAEDGVKVARLMRFAHWIRQVQPKIGQIEAPAVPGRTAGFFRAARVSFPSAWEAIILRHVDTCLFMIGCNAPERALEALNQGVMAYLEVLKPKEQDTAWAIPLCSVYLRHLHEVSEATDKKLGGQKALEGEREGQDSLGKALTSTRVLCQVPRVLQSVLPRPKSDHAGRCHRQPQSVLQGKPNGGWFASLTSRSSFAGS